MIKYFKYNYKKMIMPILILSIFGIVLLSLFTRQLTDYNINYNRNSARLLINLTLWFLVAITIFMPIYEFSIIKSKRGADLYYSLPLNKATLNLQIFIKGLIQIITIFSIVFIYLIISLSFINYDFSWIYLLPIFFILVSASVLVYGYICFVVSKANNIIDSVVMVVAYLVLPILIMTSIATIADSYIDFESFNYFNSSISLFTIFTHPLINKFLDMNVNNFLDTNIYILFAIWVVITITSTLAFIFINKYNKPEQIEQKSTSWFSYKTLIPLFVYTSITSFSLLFYTNLIILATVILVAGLVLYIISNKSFKIKWYELVTLFASGGLGVLTIYIVSNIINIIN